MLTNISWGNYIAVVALLTASWYLFVGVRFYFNDIKEIAAGKRKLQFRGLSKVEYQEFPSQLNQQDFPKNNSSESPFGEFDTIFEDVDILVERLKNVIEDAAQRKLLKIEFIEAVRLVLKDYPSVKNSPFSLSVSELIVSECDKLEYAVLDQTEAEALWN